jgi:3-methyl-2-oxobutanoate hydroxymethyltransferase
MHKITNSKINYKVVRDCQVLVTDDLIGLNKTKIRFVKKFINIKKYINLGLKKFSTEVKSKKYPTNKYSY